MSYACSICGKMHEGLPDIGHDKPAHYYDVSESERHKRIVLMSDTCELDGQHFFIRGVIEIPVLDYPEKFGLGIWVSLKKENYDIYRKNFDSSDIGPYFGWLCTHTTYYSEDTLLLKTRVHFQGNNQRPHIELEPSDHPLSIDQEQGITLDKAWEIVHYYERN